MNSHIPWSDWIAAKIGTEHWIIASTLTPAMKRKGYVKAVDRAKLKRLRAEWINGHPGVLAAIRLPEMPKRAWLIDAARHFVDSRNPIEAPAPKVDPALALHRQLCGFSA